jgi:hypothetical protein
MGGNTYNRQSVSDNEITRLVQSAKMNPLKELYGSRIFDNEKQWRANVSRHLDKLSCERFYFEFYYPQYCKICNAKLDQLSFNLPSSLNRFSKYCPTCVVSRAWTEFETDENKKLRGEKIRNSKLLFFQTTEGKKSAESVGQQNSTKMLAFNQTVQGKANIKSTAKINSAKMSEKIANGDFTPCITNSWTHWVAVALIDGVEKKYRSSWEASFAICYPHLLYEKLRIKYYDTDGKQRTYIADFYDEPNRILYELKPISSYLLQKQKMDSIIKHCLDNNIKFIWINEHSLPDYLDITKFSNINLPQYNKALNAKTKN